MIESLWSGRNKLYWLLLPLSWLYGLIVKIRRWAYRRGLFKRYRSPVPVIIVGNLSVGGNGKTPFTLYLIEALTQRNLNVGVITRGYGGKSQRYPFIIDLNTDVHEAGDEPILLFQRTQVPISVSPNRADGIKKLLSRYPNLDLIIADDGLQHYAIERDIEIVIIDSKKMLGNGHYLPAGPLRETKERLKEVDFVIFNGEIETTNKISALSDYEVMSLHADNVVNLVDSSECSASTLTNVVAIAGIGQPTRFFDTLKQLNVPTKACHTYPDHHYFTHSELSQLIKSSDNLIMTEKDKVKCVDFAENNWWYLPVNATLPEAFIPKLIAKINEFTLNKSQK